MSGTEQGRDVAPPEQRKTAGPARARARLGAAAGWLRTPPAVTTLGIVIVGALFFWGGWQRRWIADDGLIVLRTVRNLIAGNGPVFNAGERLQGQNHAACEV